MRERDYSTKVFALPSSLALIVGNIKPKATKNTGVKIFKIMVTLSSEYIPSRHDNNVIIKHHRPQNLPAP